MERLCVFCGSSPGNKPIFGEAAVEFGRALARAGIGLVYGGGSVGLMGILADAVLAAGGEVTGVIPRDLWNREVGHRGLTDLRIVGSMHERKALMAELSDGFVALPGGIGTLEELFEIWTWSLLGLHGKPCGLLNVGGFYGPLLTFLDSLVDQAFLRPEFRGIVLVDSDPARLIDQMAEYQPPPTARWIKRSTT